MEKHVLLLLSLLLTSSFAQAQPDPKFDAYLAAERLNLPVDGELLFDCSRLTGYSFGSDNGTTRKTVTVDSLLPFSKAQQLDIKKAGTNSWEPQLQTPRNTETVYKDDYLFYIFYIRVLESEADDGNGEAFLYIQKAGPPYNGLGSKSLTIRPAWTKHYLIARADQQYDPGQMEATFHLGFMKQKIEVGGIIALNLGADIDLDDLPTTPIYYDGMEANAPWRAAAAARIEQYRKGDITVLVKNSNGQAVKNASVTVKMTNHAFGFGTFIEDLVLKNDQTAIKYKAALKQLFNRATTPFYMGGNSDDWGWYSSQDVRNTYTQMAAWLDENNIITKGHVLVWPGWQWMPSFYEGLKDDPVALDDAIKVHLDEVVPIGQEFGLAEWDVVNEPYMNHDVMDALGEDVLIDWYNYVHEIDSLPRLILNEYNILAGGGVKGFQDNLARVIELLQAGNAPLGGIGMQCHFDENLTGIPEIVSILDRFGQYNIPIQVTEFDFSTRDEAAQAAFTRDFITAIFSHPATNKFVMWGFWEGMMWRPTGAMIRTDWSFKPNYYAYTDLVFNQWWTDVAGVTNRDGQYQVRGFLGDYTISASLEGASVSSDAVLTSEGLVVELTLPITGTEIGEQNNVPVEFGLQQNYPNPFNATTTIKFTSPQTGQARFSVFDVTGTLVYSRAVQVREGVEYKEEFTAEKLASGVYFYTVEFPDGSRQICKMILLK
ncbi:MAG TPA: endo-1,4-beta-xylanase [bacterium]|nr:endo-1,4-beta-xylanase [bacterium]HPN45966.1 endo-1,4-beta-xylanase [bacterium]